MIKEIYFKIVLYIMLQLVMYSMYAQQNIYFQKRHYNKSFDSFKKWTVKNDSLSRRRDSIIINEITNIEYPIYMKENLARINFLSWGSGTKEGCIILVDSNGNIKHSIKIIYDSRLKLGKESMLDTLTLGYNWQQLKNIFDSAKYYNLEKCGKYSHDFKFYISISDNVGEIVSSILYISFILKNPMSQISNFIRKCEYISK